MPVSPHLFRGTQACVLEFNSIPVPLERLKCAYWKITAYLSKGTNVRIGINRVKVTLSKCLFFSIMAYWIAFECSFIYLVALFFFHVLQSAVHPDVIVF